MYKCLKFLVYFLINLIKISPFISLSVCFCRSKGSNSTPFETRSGDLMTWYRLTNQKISCKCFSALEKLMLLSVWYGPDKIHKFSWLIYKLKRSWQEVTRTCLKRGCVRSFHERKTKQTESEMKGLILIRLIPSY